MTYVDTKDPGFQYGGVNHVALVCRDMAETVDFSMRTCWRCRLSARWASVTTSTSSSTAVAGR